MTLFVCGIINISIPEGRWPECGGCMMVFRCAVLTVTLNLMKVNQQTTLGISGGQYDGSVGCCNGPYSARVGALYWPCQPAVEPLFSHFLDVPRGTGVPGYRVIAARRQRSIFWCLYILLNPRWNIHWGAQLMVLPEQATAMSVTPGPTVWLLCQDKHNIWSLQSMTMQVMHYGCRLPDFSKTA